MNRKRLISVAAGYEKADLVLKNVNLINVISGEIYITDVAVAEGYVAGIVPGYEGIEEIDCKGMYLSPGFVDGHVHLESSMVSVGEFAKAVLPRGTTTVIVDPHEIANVAGEEGINYILESSENLPLNVYMMMPSCVPATFLETSGACINSEIMKKYSSNPKIIGLGEFMNYPGVINGDEEVLKKMSLFSEKIIDGHAPMVTDKQLCAYRAAGVTSEHECTTVNEALEKLRMGMYIMLREGSATKNLRDLLPLLNRYNDRFCFFSTDDRHPDDLINEGHIDNMVKILVSEQGNITRAVRLASKNACEYFGLKELGAVAPGYRADMLLIEDFSKMKINKVFKDGKIVAENGKALFETHTLKNSKIFDSVNISNIDSEKFEIKIQNHNKSYKMNVIEVIPSQIITKKIQVKPKFSSGKIISDVDNDIVKFAVVERHNNTGNIGLGFVKGFGLKKGAIATTVSHDSHNMNIIGVEDSDMALCANRLKEIGGGLVVAQNGKITGELPLPLAGLMTDSSLESVSQKIQFLHNLCYNLGVVIKDPFITMAFLALPVIPELKLTDKGLVDVQKFEIIELLEEF
ncbi:MAG: adenine deaminase [Candidatus Muiribacteriota bacterium]